MDHEHVPPDGVELPFTSLYVHTRENGGRVKLGVWIEHKYL